MRAISILLIISLLALAALALAACASASARAAVILNRVDADDLEDPDDDLTPTDFEDFE